jgi:hydrogenase small subunit
VERRPARVRAPPAGDLDARTAPGGRAEPGGDGPRDGALGGRLSRRALLKFCTLAATLLALPPHAAPLLAAALAKARRLPVVWLSFQACSGCSESLTRSAAPTIERLLFELISLDYHPLLQAASGDAAEAAREAILVADAGRVLVVVDGSVPTATDGCCSTSAGETGLSLLARCLEAAGVVIAVGTCAAFGGLPAAVPNPTGAMGIGTLMALGRIPRRPLVNLPGCPPLPEAVAAVLAHHVTFGCMPDLDNRNRPRALYGATVHERCARRGHFEAGRFAQTFDDEGARAGWCLLELGCKGPVTRNACASVRWNGASNPIESGHPCLGCSESGFWDQASVYQPLRPEAVASGDCDDPSARRGAAIYDDRCVYCHDTDPARLKTPVDEIPALLRSGKSRFHRFALADGELQALLDFLKEPRK